VAGAAGVLPAVEDRVVLPRHLVPGRYLGADLRPAPGRGPHPGRPRPRTLRRDRGRPQRPGRVHRVRRDQKVSGRKVFAVVDTIGLLLAVVVVAANTSDNAGGIACVTKAAPKTCRLTKIWSDSSFRVEFAKFCASLGIKAEVAKRIVDSGFAVIPRRWVVERSFAWLVNNRRLRTDYERDPEVTAGMIWAAHTRVLLRRLTTD
jgi:transposase